jgi:hypothetical protein
MAERGGHPRVTLRAVAENSFSATTRLSSHDQSEMFLCLERQTENRLPSLE